jgi:hypothetical protein
VSPFAYGIIGWFVGVCLVGEWLQRRSARTRPPSRVVPVSSEDLERIYEPLYVWVLDAEENGTITEGEAAEAIDALLEAESLEWQFLAPPAVDGPPMIWRRP